MDDVDMKTNMILVMMIKMIYKVIEHYEEIVLRKYWFRYLKFNLHFQQPP